MANKNLKKLAEQIGGTKLERTLSASSGVFKKKIKQEIKIEDGNDDINSYKIIKIRADDMQTGYACYFIASSVEMAEKKAKGMTYRNPKGLEISLDNQIRNERYFKDGLEHAKNHEPCGNPCCDAFLICHKHDDEKESKESICRKRSDEYQQKTPDERFQETVKKLLERTSK